MTGVDTNVLVRFLTRDDPAQFRRADAFLCDLARRGELAFVDVVVLCELVWVLETAYGYDRSAISSALEGMLSASDLAIQERDRVRAAATAYRDRQGDFADHLIGELNAHAGCDKTVTFDRKLRSSARFQVL